MGYQVKWLLENRIMLISYEGVITSTDLDNYLAETMDMRDRANALLGEHGPFVHTITDARRMTSTKLGLRDAVKAVELVRKQRVGWTLYISTNKLDVFLASVGHQLAGVRYRTFATVTEAVNFLTQVDETLRDFNYTGD